MSISVLYNTSALAAQNQLNITSSNLQKTLMRLASGSRLNSGADDAAGLAIANGLNANIAALTQSAQNANNGVGILQTADGALAQVTNLLTRAVTLATESASGSVGNTQRVQIDAEFKAIQDEIDRIGTNTTYNGQAIFTATPTDIFLSDSTATGSSSISVTTGVLGKTNLGGIDVTQYDLLNQGNATNAVDVINQAIQGVAAIRGQVGAGINRLQAASQVVSAQTQNLTSAVNTLTAADISAEVANMTNFNILMQTGMSALSQANQSQQAVLKLLQ